MALLKPGDKAIPFTLIGVDERHYSLVNYTQSKVLVLIFSCNHCPYVRAWEDRMIKLQADYGKQDVQLLAINANDAVKYPDDSFAKMKQRAYDKDFNFPYLYNEDQQVAREYGAERTPEVFLFDRNGTLRYHGAIDDNYEDATAVKHHYVRDAIEALLHEQEPPITQTAPVGCTIKWR